MRPHLAMEPGGRFLYGTASTQLFGYAIHPAAGTLTALPASSFPPPGSPTCAYRAMAVAPSGLHAYVMRLCAQVAVFAVDPATGGLLSTPISIPLGQSTNSSGT